MSLQTKVILLSILNGLIILLIVTSLFYFSLAGNIEKQISTQALNVANLAASRPDVIDAYLSSNPSSPLQEVSEEIVQKTNAVFVVFLNMEGVRFTHPDPSLIGKLFTGGDEGPALREGKIYTSKAVGISGPSIRAFSPVMDHAGRQIGAVAVGYWGPDISNITWDMFKILYIIIPISLFFIGVFSYLLATHVKNILFGMEPIEIATKLEEREIMLESVREGIIAIDSGCKITVANSAARRIISPEHQVIGKDIGEVIPNTKLPAVLQSAHADPDEQMLLNKHMVLVNRAPLFVEKRLVGAISTFRDMTEINALAEELTGANKIVDTLRARTHEFMNKLQAVSGLIQLGAYAEAEQYITRITKKEQSFIEFLLKNINSPTVAGLLEGKTSEAQERNIKLSINPASKLSYLPSHFDENSMVIVLGNLLDNAMDAVQDLPVADRRVEGLILQDDEQLCIQVSDSGRGIPSDLVDKIFTKGFTTKKNGMGYGLANVKSRVNSAFGTISVQSNEHGSSFQIKIPNYPINANYGGLCRGEYR